jgi:hypothetical protein
MVSLSIPSGLPDSTGNDLDGVVVKLLENIKGCDHLIVVEGFSHPLAKQKNALEHVYHVPMQIDFKDATFMRVVLVFLVFILIVAIALVSVFVEGNTPFALGLVTRA